MFKHRQETPPAWIMLLAFVVTMSSAVPLRAQHAAGATARAFATPEAAITALTAAAAAGDKETVHAIFGPGINDLMTGDTVEDNSDFREFAVAITKLCNPQHVNDGKIILNIGPENWPFPIPLEKQGGSWMFNTAAGKDEMVARNIGEDELNAINVCRAFVRAEQEYFAELHDSSAVHAYAARFRSTEGKRDGLYWEPVGNEPLSPFGPLVADAQAEGYSDKPLSRHRRPFHGYFFKILHAQGAAAPGGAYDYVINGNMIGGFAMVAYPAQWGASGIMTFIVNQEGKVYQSNLGDSTISTADAMTTYNPDAAWTHVGEMSKK